MIVNCYTCKEKFEYFITHKKTSHARDCDYCKRKKELIRRKEKRDKVKKNAI